MNLIKKIKKHWKPVLIYLFMASGIVSVTTSIVVKRLTDLNQPPMAQITVSSREGVVPHRVTFDASRSSDPEGKRLLYAWRIDDQLVSNASFFTHTFNKVGVSRIELTVIDNKNAATKNSDFIKTLCPERVISAADALQYYHYELAWLGPHIQKLKYYSVETVGIQQKFIHLKYQYKNGEIHAVANARDYQVLGVWQDEEGEGLLNLVFNDDFSVATGWWSYDNGHERYQIRLRRIDMDKKMENSA